MKVLLAVAMTEMRLAPFTFYLSNQDRNFSDIVVEDFLT